MMNKAHYSKGLFDPYSMSTATERNYSSKILQNKQDETSSPPKELSLRYITKNRVNETKLQVTLKPEQKKECSCERGMKNILCRSCGNVFYGRIRYPCSVHPNVVHLMDICSCPKCRAGLLKEFQTTKGKA